MCKENEILFIFQYITVSKDTWAIYSRHNAFDVNCLFRTYIFTLAAAEADLLFDYFEETIMKPQTEHRADFHASPTGATAAQNFNDRLHRNFGMRNLKSLI
jgi:hypothetical protein